MVLHGHFPVGLLQAVIVCSGGNPQQIVEFCLLHHFYVQFLFCDLTNIYYVGCC